jgi:hypothetical protein
MLLGGFWCKVGGHSLLATQATSRIRGTFGIDLPLATVCDQPTIADLATVIGSTMLGTDAEFEEFASSRPRVPRWKSHP